MEQFLARNKINLSELDQRELDNMQVEKTKKQALFEARSRAIPFSMGELQRLSAEKDYAYYATFYNSCSKLWYQFPNDDTSATIHTSKAMPLTHDAFGPSQMMQGNIWQRNCFTKLNTIFSALTLEDSKAADLSQKNLEDIGKYVPELKNIHKRKSWITTDIV